MVESIKVLITVKTYPNPSTKYEETVCTVGVREDGSFIRLYPIDYRNKPYDQWYKKYQWVEVSVKKNLEDVRPESYRPVGDIKPIGDPLNTKNDWAERKKYVLARGVSTMCGLQKYQQKEVSLGVIKPKSVERFIVEEQAERDWKPEVLTRMKQTKLFGATKSPLEKIPFKFSYSFFCEADGCSGHKMMIEDWEAGQLFRDMRTKFGDEGIACEKIKQKFFDAMCAEDIDTHFFVGTVLEHGTWVILGVFWPKKR